MTAHARSRLLLLGAVLFTVVAVHYAAGHQQAESERTQARVDVVDHLRIAMVDQETGLRGFAQTGEATFLDPFYAGRRQFANDLEEARRLLGDDAPAASPLNEQASVAAAWQESALRAIASVRARGMGAIRPADARKRKAMMGRFRVANSELDAWVREDRASSLTAARRNVDLAVIIVGRCSDSPA